MLAKSPAYINCYFVYFFIIFRFRIIGVENLKNYDGQLFITAGLFHGGELMQPKISATQLVDGCTTPRWYEWVSTEMPIYNVSINEFSFRFR